MGINEDLVAKWQAGDSAALEDLWRRNEGLRVNLAVKFARRMEHDERMAEVAIAFMLAANGYKSTGSTFGCYLGVAVANRFHGLWQRSRVKKRTAIVRSLDARRHGDKPPLIECVGRVDDVPENAAFREAVEAAEARLRRLPGRYAEIVRRRCEGRTLDEIGAAQGVTREAVRKVEIQAMTWLRMTDEEFAEERAVRKSLGAKPRGNKPARVTT